MSDTPITHSAPAFFKIFVSDLAASVAFYQNGLGFQEKRRINAPEFEEVIMAPANSGASLILCRYNDGRAVTRGNAHGPIGFFTTNMDQLHAGLLAAGAVPIFGPAEVHKMRIAILSDLDGHPIEIIQTPGR